MKNSIAGVLAGDNNLTPGGTIYITKDGTFKLPNYWSMMNDHMAGGAANSPTEMAKMLNPRPTFDDLYDEAKKKKNKSIE